MRLLITFALLALLADSSPMPPTATLPADHVPGRFVFGTGYGPLGDERSTRSVLGYTIVEVPADGEPSEQAASLSRELGIDVTPMVMYEMLADPTAEPLFADQWALENSGQTGGLSGADIGVTEAWPWVLGEGVVVAVIDSGVDLENAELAPGLWLNGGEVPDNGIDDDGNGFIDDRQGWDFVSGQPAPSDSIGHGTAVASVVAASANGVGMAGVAPAAGLMAVKVCDTFGCPADAVAEGIVYAVDNGAEIINLSLGAPGVEPLVTAAVEYALGRDVLVVAAAGNAGADLDVEGTWTPVGIDGVVGVAWTDDEDELASLSNYGEVSVDLAAPGQLVLSATPGGGYETKTGSSFSAPHVAGVAALMRSISPEMDVIELAELLGSTGDPRDSLASAVGSGRRLDAGRAVQAARFRDIPDSVFADDIMWAADAGITRGCTATLFCPDDVITRGQAAAFLARAFGLPPSDTDAFTDDEGTIFEDDIDRLAATGITTGCSPTAFCPDDPVTRQEMAAFFVRRYGYPPPAPGVGVFTDVGESVFADDIARLAGAGVTKGCNPPLNDRFCPLDSLTRAQMTAFLRRAG